MLSYQTICQVRRISQAALDKLRTVPSDQLVWRANENDPRKHTSCHEGLFYELPDAKQCQEIFGLPSPYHPMVTKYYEALGFRPIMIRRPALDVMNYIENMKPSMPNIRMLLYGDYGNGKTHSIVHLMHYMYLKREHFIIQLGDVRRITRSTNSTESISRPGRLDQTLTAAVLLQLFRTQNGSLLERFKENLVCSKDYKWSIREITPAGAPLIDVIEHGINRVIHAADCFAVLIKELIIAADEGKIKIASLLDGIDTLYIEETPREVHADLKRVMISEITLARAFKRLIKENYKNGVVVATGGSHFIRSHNRTPGDILGVDGWKEFDPFLPIHVPKYNRKEFESCMNMYQDSGWLCRPESRTQEVRNEIRFISGLNPKQVELLCRSI